MNRHIRHHHPAPGEANRADGPASEKLHQENNSPLPNAEYNTEELRSGSPSSQDAVVPPQDTRTAEQTNSEALHIQGSIHHAWENMQFDMSQDVNATYNGDHCGFIDNRCEVHGMDGMPAQQPTDGATPQPEFNSQHPVFDLFGDLSQEPNVGDVMPANMDFEAVLDGLLLTPPRSGDQQPRQPSKTNISNEQFEQVRRLWPTRRRTATQPLCWDDILLYHEDNVFSSTTLMATASLEQSIQTDSGWKFNDACRERLVRSLSQNHNPHVDQAMQPVRTPSNHGALENGFPPADILDLCLDLYFHRFHVHMPFVHPPTFNASATPSILLFPMCVVGMMILNRGMASKLIKHYLPVSCLFLSSTSALTALFFFF